VRKKVTDAAEGQVRAEERGRLYAVLNLDANMHLVKNADSVAIRNLPVAVADK